jgi:polysaccharide biosynthesis transport protein
LVKHGGSTNSQWSPSDPWSSEPRYDPIRIKGLLDPAQEEQKSLFDYLRTILKRKWTMVGVFLGSVAISAAYAYTRAPYYISSATMQIDKMYSSAGNLNDLLGLFGQFDLYYQTQIEALKSKGVAEAYLVRSGALKQQPPAPEKPAETASVDGSEQTGTPQKAGTAEDAKELQEQRNRQSLVDSVLGRVKVVPLRGTQMIEVSLGANDPLLAKRMLQGYLDAFLADSRQKRTELTGRVRSLMTKELEATEKQYEEAKNALFKFTEEHGIVHLDRSPNPMLGEFDKAADALLRSKTDRLDLEALNHQKEKVLPPKISNEYLQNMKSKLAGLKAEYTSLKSVYDPNYFKMALMRNKIKSMEEAIGEVEQNALNSALGAARTKEAATERNYEDTKAEAIKKHSLTVQYGVLKKAVEAHERLYLMLKQKAKQAEIDQGTMGHDIVVSSPPSLPLAPVSPRKGNILFMGAMVGLLLGVGLAIVMEFMDNTVQSTQEIQERLNLPILGAVPRLTGGRGELEIASGAAPPEFAAYHFPASPFTDAVRIVQNAAASFLPQKAGVSMIVTSALPLEGKTLISVVLGTVIASEQKRVLIVDGDLRNPRIHDVFQSQPNDTGLSDLLTGKVIKLKEAIRESHVPGLYFLPAGISPENPVALLKTDRLKEILEACKKVFDVVILDAPPVLGLVDARILATHADGLILVTRAGHTPLEMLRQAKDAVYQVEGRLLGIVLNMTDRRSGGYGSYYPYDSKYYSRYYHRGRKNDRDDSENTSPVIRPDVS